MVRVENIKKKKKKPLNYVGSSPWNDRAIKVMSVVEHGFYNGVKTNTSNLN